MSKRYGNIAGRRFSEACGNERLSCSFRAGLKVPSVNRQLRTNERRNRIEQCTAENVTLMPRWKTQSSVGMEAIEVHVKDLRYAAIGNTFPQSSQLGSHIRTRTIENEQCIPSINKSPPERGNIVSWSRAGAGSVPFVAVDVAACFSCLRWPARLKKKPSHTWECVL